MADQIISHVLNYEDESALVVLTDGTRLNLTEADVEMIQFAFPGECEACGFHPDHAWSGRDDEDDYEEG